MNHEQYQEHISLYVDHALSDRESADLFAHLGGCDECRNFMKITLRVHSQIGDEGLSEVPLSLDRRVLGSALREKAEVRRRSWYAPVWFTRVSIPVPAAASILFLIIVGSLLASPLLSPRSAEQSEVKDPLATSILGSVQNQLKLYR